jgi:hypothetical protein
MRRPWGSAMNGGTAFIATPSDRMSGPPADTLLPCAAWPSSSDGFHGGQGCFCGGFSAAQGAPDGPPMPLEPPSARLRAASAACGRDSERDQP